MFDRLEVIGERDEARRLERPPLDPEGVDDGVEIGGCAQRKAGMIREEAHALARRLLRRGHPPEVGERLQVRQLFAARGRDGEVRDRLDDAVELERSKGVRVHG